MKIHILTLSALLLSSPVMSGEWAIKDAKIISIANAKSNLDTFTIWIAGGSGFCSNQTISFPVDFAFNAGVHDRAYQTALLAIKLNATVDVYSYNTSDICENAAYIKMSYSQTAN
ncbi:hypothetical protein PULV_b0049 [Pseudoalteromonas ulvae UL12]|uniref:Uncharacterized protein n=1 Tax=Pseudoalteromonas ulvae TaxID=107327 RepID=A0A244CR04_PSEDV|nr:MULTISPECIES: DUF5992 family protein [Pseudoalteromonas]MBE0365472.1 hypothetical protein [Pseudoalteromonas ulvae UL12]MDP5215570.1 DUF5992 family protein [Pseudoalteromonas tunicata]OUL58025.1 hypothetical protein B1199_06610 [Pseudoalteromonas ulvae]